MVVVLLKRIVTMPPSGSPWARRHQAPISKRSLPLEMLRHDGFPLRVPNVAREAGSALLNLGTKLFTSKKQRAAFQRIFGKESVKPKLTCYRFGGSRDLDLAMRGHLR